MSGESRSQWNGNFNNVLYTKVGVEQLSTIHVTGDVNRDVNCIIKDELGVAWQKQKREMKKNTQWLKLLLWRSVTAAFQDYEQKKMLNLIYQRWACLVKGGSEKVKKWGGGNSSLWNLGIS